MGNGIGRERGQTANATLDRVSPASLLLDAVRGLAAVLVVAGHCRQLIADAGGLDPGGSSTVDKLLLAPSGFAQESVAVFFVLSGYLVGGQVLRQCTEDRFTWGEYLVKRLSRLWTVLVPGLLATWVVVAAAGPMIPSTLATRWGGNNDSAGDAACNAAFLQESRCPRYGVNESLWSLSYEFWFYILFAGVAALAISVRHRRRGAAALNLVIVLGSLDLFGLRLLVLMPAWLLGVAVSLPSAQALGARLAQGVRALGAAVVCVGLAMVATSVLALDRSTLTAVVAIPSTALVLIASRIEMLPSWLAIGARNLARLGRVSFSTYVFHVPFVALGAALLGRSGWAARAGLPLATYGLMLTVLPVTWLAWWLTERHTPAVRALALRIVSHAGPDARVLKMKPGHPAVVAETADSGLAQGEPASESKKESDTRAGWQAWEEITRGWKTEVRYDVGGIGEYSSFPS